MRDAPHECQEKVLLYLLVLNFLATYAYAGLGDCRNAPYEFPAGKDPHPHRETLHCEEQVPSSIDLSAQMDHSPSTILSFSVVVPFCEPANSPLHDTSSILHKQQVLLPHNEVVVTQLKAALRNI